MAKYFAVLLGLVVATGLMIPDAQSAALETIKVSNTKKRFFVNSKAVLDAPLEDVYDTLIDFDNYERFSSVYHDAHWVERNDDDSGEIYTYTRGCIVFFCKGFERTESVEATPHSTIKTIVDAERSDAVHGISTWDLVDVEGGTEVTFALEFEPKFWVPPVIGPFMVKRMLKKNGKDALVRIEVLAQERGRDNATAPDTNNHD